MNREHVIRKIRELTRPVAQRGLDFWAEEDARRQGELADLILARMDEYSAFHADLDAICVKPADFLGETRFRDYLVKVGVRVESRRAEYRATDKVLLEAVARSLASFRVRYRKFAAEMGDDYQRFDKSMHFWKYAKSHEIRIDLVPPPRRKPGAATREAEADVPFENVATVACMSA